jgi:hypothetical protein
VAYADLNGIHDPATNTIPPASWGDQVRDNDEFLVATPQCTIAASVAQAVTTGTTGEALTGTESIDTDSMHAGSSATVTMQTAGKYELTTTVQFDSGSTNRCFVKFVIEGDNYSVGQVPPTGGGFSTIISGTRHYEATAGDEAEVWVAHDKGSDLDVTLLEFTAKWIGR